MKFLYLIGFIFTSSAFASSGVNEFAGIYNCTNVGETEAFQIVIDGEQSTIQVTQDGNMMFASLVDRTNLLSPFKKDLGIAAFLVTINGKAHDSLEFLKTRSGKLIVMSGRMNSVDDSRSTETSVKITADSVCVPN